MILLQIPMLKHILFAGGLLLFLPALRQHQLMSFLAFAVYLGYLIAHYAGKGMLVKKLLFLPLVAWSAIAIMEHDYSMMVLVAIFPALFPDDEGDKTSFYLRWVIWAAVPIAVFLIPAQGVSIPEKIHSHALALMAVLLSLITIPAASSGKGILVPEDDDENTDSSPSSRLLLNINDEDESEEKDSHSEIPTELISAALKLDYKGFDKESAIKTTLDTITVSSKVKYAAYYRADMEHGQYLLTSVSGNSPLRLQKSYPFGVGMVGQVYTSGTYIYANGLLDKELDGAKKRLLRGMDALLSMPVAYKNESVGVIYIGFSRMGKEEQTACISLCEIIAEKLGSEFERLDVHSNVEKKSQTDKLTGLYNRQFFDDAIEEEFRKAKATGNSLAYVLLDLDFFKQINDTSGHDFGDKVLRLASEVFTRNIRKSDYACRTGGDEFSLILTNISKEAVYNIIKRIREDYARVVEENHLYAKKDGKPVKSSLSIGIAVYPHPRATSAQALIKLADLAVYHVKENGKNSFCFVK